MDSRRSKLEHLLSIALDHETCATEKAWIDGDAVVMPFDCFHPDRKPQWTIQYERVRSRQDLLDAFGYG